MFYSSLFKPTIIQLRQVCLLLCLLLFLLPILLLTACAGTEKTSTTPNRPEETTIDAELKSTASPAMASNQRLSALTPWFHDALGGKAALALQENRLQDAVALFDELIPTLKSDTLRQRARFLAAYNSFYAGDSQRALTELPPLARTLPLLEEVVYEVSALAAFRLNRFDESIFYAGKIESVNQTAALLMGDAAMQLEQYDNALLQYRKVMAKWPHDTKAECQAKIVSCIVHITEPYQLNATPSPPSAQQIAPPATDEAIDTDKEMDTASAADSDDKPKKHMASTPADTKDTEPDSPALANEVDAAQEKVTPADTNAYLRMLIDEALNIITAMSAQSPSGKWTREACAHEDTLRARIGEKPSPAKTETRVAQNLFDDAHEDMLKRRHEKALKGYKKAIKFAKRNGDLECRARYEEALVTSFLRQHSDAASMFEAVASDCADPEIRLKSLYKAGSAHMSADQHDDAIRMYAEVEKQFSAHSYADDARLHGARAWLAKGDENTFLKMISTLPDDYPGGDMRAEALWLGAKRALDRKRFPQAREILAKYFKMFPIEKGWYTAGRAAYWYGRVMELMGDTDDAMRQYEYTVTTSPFTFYMVLAYSRLNELNELGAKLLAAELTPKRGEEPDAIPKSLLTDGPFAVGVELIRLGLISRGTKQIKALLRKSGTAPSVHRAAATLFRHVGSFADSKEITDSLDGWRSRYPTGEDYMDWSLAYPMAFEKDVAFASAESGVDSALIFAIMREESSFNASIESWANAMGLMQLILPTARAMGAQLGIKVNRSSLREPHTNIRLGAMYLKNLSDSVGGNPALMIPGYNAGGGAVSRWLRENGDMALDQFVESIPFGQTRGYTKRVLSTFATYRFLYGTDHPFTVLDFDVKKYR
ncbi:MAG: transglycosylase SLT domain-containing protein [Deltaproteobacteria bacterium]|nr:transglycosylase SLT domain-containing protein [Deltaproteobacteria bacterium]